MTTMTRKIRRAAFRKNAKEWVGQEQQTVDLPNGGYMTLTPTKGWKRVSGARIRAQTLMAQRFGFVK